MRRHRSQRTTWRTGSASRRATWTCGHGSRGCAAGSSPGWPRPRTASVIADSDLKVLVIGAREFAGIVDEIPSIAHKLMKSLAARIRELDTKAYG